MPANPGTTNPVLLRRLADWRDHPAWGEFVALYDPLIRSRCLRFHVRGDVAEDLCQRIWIGLSDRLATFRYDPNGSFRAWLRRYCDSRLIDWLRERKPDRCPSIEEVFGPEGPAARDDDELTAAGCPRFLSLGVEIHRRVQAQVNAETWTAFWLVAIEDRSVREAAGRLGKSYAAVFAAQKRVRKMLRDEGRKALDGLVDTRSVPA